MTSIEERELLAIPFIMIGLGVAIGFMIHPDASKAITILWSEVDKTGSKLSDIADANSLSSASNGQVIYRNNNQWSSAIPENTITSLPWSKVNKVGSKLSDIEDSNSLSSATNGKIIYRNNNQWTPATPEDTITSLPWSKVSKIGSKLSDIEDSNSLSGASNGRIIYRNNNQWTPAVPEDTITSLQWSKVSKTGSKLDDIGDVNAPTPQVGQVLKWNGTQWISDTDNTGSGSGNSLNPDIFELGYFNPSDQTDDTPIFQNAVDNCKVTGCIIHFSGSADVSNLIINKNYVTIQGITGFLSDNSVNRGSTLRQINSNQPIINLIRGGSSKSIGVNDDHLYSFRLIDVMLDGLGTSTVPLIDSIDFKMRSGEASLATKSLKALVLERVSILSSATNAPAHIRLYNLDINSNFKSIRIHQTNIPGILLISSNHNSGNINIEDISYSSSGSTNSRGIKFIAGEDSDGGNLNFVNINHLRSFGSTSNNIVNDYLLEIVGKSGDARYFLITNARTEETPLIYAHSDGSGDVEHIVLLDWTYRDRRLGSGTKMGIVLNDTSTSIGTVQNVHILDGNAIRGALVNGNTPPNINTAIYDRGIDTYISFDRIYFENVNERVNEPTTPNLAKYIENKRLISTLTLNDNATNVSIAKNIPHGLEYIPDFTDITLVYDISSTTGLTFSIPPYIDNIDANNITIRLKYSLPAGQGSSNITFYILIQ